MLRRSQGPRGALHGWRGVPLGVAICVVSLFVIASCDDGQEPKPAPPLRISGMWRGMGYALWADDPVNRDLEFWLTTVAVGDSVGGVLTPFTNALDQVRLEDGRLEDGGLRFLVQYGTLVFRARITPDSLAGRWADRDPRTGEEWGGSTWVAHRIK
jgi:hypothetical protein